ncbi:GNAT family N-acetyltransferase [Saccharibacillus alkalitolerans]|uniref:GNAT family N-acetyltransferase n=1 Tax=Saccharibacillus alkalitolerans TaxID=2705290 RepID=A0ABX0FDP0_9BACL|nr:GNAT family N-acetyltransferase [Saccharibacillus alkalitolerans]NGZ76467.1 GNAT family N-acetyltransferase [Saccharibacillus alkalitolerans]
MKENKKTAAIKVVRFGTEHIPYINDMNDAFPIFGRLVPSFRDGEWTHEEELFADVRIASFPDDRLDWDTYIGSDHKAVFLAFYGSECVGQVRLVRDWTGYAYIENIAVRGSHRGRGVSGMLMDKAEQWAREQELHGLSLEAQGDNLAACRFYLKRGMRLGGVDTLKQAFNPEIETTLYFYEIFEEPSLNGKE